MMKDYPRNMIGYGAIQPEVKWPNNARLALQIVLNYEEGGESNILHGDDSSEAFLSEIIGASPIKGSRNMNMESIYEYGSRRGFWRLYEIFSKNFKIPITIFAVAMALKRNNEICAAIKESKFEVASHGYRWIDYQNINKDIEREHMKLSIKIINEIFGERPLGWYTGRCSPNTKNLVVEDGGFLYHSDSYSDDLPYWEIINNKSQLVVPYTLDNNDMRFVTNQGFNNGEDFYQYLKDSFDTLYKEGEQNPKMMSLGLHCRLIGRPGRINSLIRFLDYALKHNDVWICKRIDIAKHWISNYAQNKSD
ncbi:MAG: allantoinase PuuE [Pelagibacteraceae bacterium]|nr:allantoinase PuuE [Pelagibacteraceae bacterium]